MLFFIEIHKKANLSNNHCVWKLPKIILKNETFYVKSNFMKKPDEQ